MWNIISTFDQLNWVDRRHFTGYILQIIAVAEYNECFQ